MSPREAGAGGHMCLRDPPLLSESKDLSRRREAVVSALGRVERAVASLGQDLDKRIAAVAS
jgi:hypothetical protein